LEDLKGLTLKDFEKAYQALKKADVKEPYYFVNRNGKGLLTPNGVV